MLLYEFYKEMSTRDCDPDDIFVSDVHAERHEGVEVDHIYKVRIIDIEQVKDTLEITTHKSVRTNSPKIPRNYITNDCMIRYKRINEYFYMDNFFSTKKVRKIHATKHSLSDFCNRQRVCLCCSGEVEIICAEGSEAIRKRNWCAIFYHSLSLKRA